MKMFVLIIAMAAIVSGCGGSETETTTANTNVVPNSNAASGANSNLVPYESNIDPNAFNGNSNNLRVVNADANGKASFGPRNAPDNSVFESTMNAKGEVLETRTFKDHPQLLKIVRKTSGTTATLKVYLKNGKIYDASEEKIPNFTAAAPLNVLIAVGAAPKPEPNPDEKKASDEKKQEQRP